MLNFIGTGSAFNTELGNTSAFIKKDNALFLIDCGGTVFHRLQELKLLNGVKDLYVVITHTHPDHIGSLGEVIFYSHYILENKPTIFFPKKDLIETFLTCIGVSSEMYCLESSNSAVIRDKSLGNINIEFLSNSHVDTIPSYGLIININGKTIYYSGDTNSINDIILNKLKCGEIDFIYQDTCGLDYKGNNHLSLKRLCELVSKELRNKVYCMHLDKHILKEEIESNGFNVTFNELN